MSWIQKQLKKDEGFTLIELMVVVLIIAILIAIAIPTFLGARERAQDRAAQSNLRNSLTAAKVFYTDTEDFAVVVADLTAIEPSLAFVAGGNLDGADASNVVRYAVEDNGATQANQIITFYAISASGNTFCISETAVNGTNAAGTTYAGGAALTYNRAGCAGTSW